MRLKQPQRYRGVKKVVTDQEGNRFETIDRQLDTDLMKGISVAGSQFTCDPPGYVVVPDPPAPFASVLKQLGWQEVPDEPKKPRARPAAGPE